MGKRAIGAIGALAVVASLLIVTATPAGADATYVVNTPVDGPGDAGACVSGSGACTLRQAVAAGNADGGAVTINVPPGDYVLDPPSGIDEATGDLDVTGDLTIVGTGATAAIDPNFTDRAFEVHVGGELALTGNLWIRNGLASSGGAVLNGGTLTVSGPFIGPNESTGDGGAIENLGALTIGPAFTRFLSNTAGGIGGAIHSTGSVSISLALFDSNAALGGGGAIAASPSGPLSIDRSSFQSNSTSLGSGGALLVDSITALIAHSSFVQNHSQLAGGAIASDTWAVASNTLFELNTVEGGGGGGGAIDAAFISLVHVTVIDNTEPGIASSAFFEMGNSIAEDTCVLSGAQTIDGDLGGNVGDASCGVDIVGSAGLAPLAFTTFAYRPLTPGSPAIDLIPPGQCLAAEDQNYTPRPQGAGCDSGAIEYVPGPSVPPIDTGRIVFSGDDGSGNHDIWTVEPDATTHRTRLTTDAAPDTDPMWSPDGSQIVFVAQRDGHPQLYIMNADGSNEHNISNNAESDADPSWSPDGTTIAFSTFRASAFGRPHIWLMDADGSNQRPLTTDDSSWDSHPTWSPDGQYVYFDSSPAVAESDIVRIPVAGGATETIVDGPGTSDVAPDVSPDGTRLAYQRPTSASDIVVSDIDGTGELQVTNNGVDSTSPAFSPSGAWIAYADGNEHTIRLVTPEASASLSLPMPFTDVGSPDWTATPALGLANLTAFDGPTTVSAGGVTIPIDAIDDDALADADVVATPDQLAALPLRSIDLTQSPTTAATPLGSIPLRSIPLRSIPLRSISLTDLPVLGGWADLLSCVGIVGECDDRYLSTPLASISFGDALELPQVEDLPLEAISFAATPLGSIPLGSIALATVPLRSIPLFGDTEAERVEAWCAIVEAEGLSCAELGLTSADSDVTMLALSLAGVPLRSIPLGSIPLRSIPLRSIPLGSIPLASIAIGSTPLRSIPLRSIPLRSIPLGSIPLRSIPLRSIPLGSIPLRSIPLRSIELGSIPLRSVPLRSIELGATPLRSIPLRSIPLGSIPLRSIPLRSIELGSIPLRSIPLRSIADVVDCQLISCTGDATLVDALDAGALRIDADLGDLDETPELVDTVLADLADRGITEFDDLSLADLLDGWETDATLGDLSDVDFAQFDDMSLADLLEGWDSGAILGDLGVYGGTSLAALIESLPEELQQPMTLGGVLAGLLPRADYPWEKVDVDAATIRSFASGGSVAPYTVAFDVAFGPTDVDVELELPVGAAVIGTATLDGYPIDATSATTWHLPRVADGPHELVVPVSAGDVLGAFTAAARATTVGGTTELGLGGTIVDDPDVGDTLATSSPLVPDTITFGHMGSRSDVDLYSLVVPESSLASISLSNLSFDGDLVLYSPSPTLPGIVTRTVAPVDETAASLSAVESRTPPQTLDDVPLLRLPGYSVYAVGGHRSTDDETIATAPLRPGTYYVQVSGYNGSFNSRPYALRAKLIASPAPSTCAPRVLALNAADRGTIPAVGPDVDTLFVVNQERFAAMHPGRLGDLLASLAAVDGAGGVHSAVIGVDGDPAVRAAYAQWDTGPGRCAPDAANAVVRAIGDIVNGIRAAHPAVRNVVLVGADDVVPMGRVPDTTTYANERGFGSTLEAIDEVSSSLSAGFVLTDDVYADAGPVAVGTALQYVPEVAVGRLVHTADQIVGALDRFVASDGVIDDGSALTTGYDFLTDGAQEIAGSLGQGRDATTLIRDDWTRAELREALLPDNAPSPNVAAVNAHFDPARALPASGNLTHDETDLFTTDDVRAFPDALLGRLLFSMGCHAGLDLPDPEIGATVDTWAKAFADQGALWVANTGYGYGDTETVALSEQLLSHFAENLNVPITVGDALMFAKQRFAGGLSAVSAYDMKSSMESTFYGLPMYRLASADGEVPPLPTPRPTTTEPLTGLTVAAIDEAPATTLQTSDAGEWYEGAQGTVAVPGRPLQPVETFDVSQPGLDARGALITDLVSTDIGSFTPRIFRPIVDDGGVEIAPAVGDVAFPSTFQSITEEFTPSGPIERLVLVPAQFVSDGEALDGSGTQRRFTEVDTLVHYAPAGASDDFDPPFIASSTSHAIDNAVAFTVDAADAFGPVSRVLVLWSVVPEVGTSAPREWEPADLTLGVDGRWSGSAPAPGVTEESDIEYLVQAVDAVGNVGTSTNKGVLFQAQAPPAPGDVTIDLTGTESSGWFVDDANVTVSGIVGEAVYFLDGAGAQALTTDPIAVTGDGVHTLRVESAAGQVAERTFVIDASAPTVTLTASPGHLIVDALDGGSGIDRVRWSGPGGTFEDSSAHIDITTEPGGTYTVVAIDRVGHSSEAVVHQVEDVDTTPPVISCSEPVWQEPVGEVTCTATDPESGLSPTSPATFTLTGTIDRNRESDAVPSTTQEVCNTIGLCVTAGPIALKVDRKAPTISVTAPRGWQSAGQIVVDAADGGSGIAEIRWTDPDGITHVHVGDHLEIEVPPTGKTTWRFVAVDAVGHVSRAKRVVVRVDATAPLVSCATPSPAWQERTGSVRCTATDAESGLHGSSPDSFTLTATVPDGTESTNALTTTRELCNRAGACTTAGPFSMKVDRKAPTIALTSPVANARYSVGQVVPAVASCVDGGSGVARCVVPAVDTSKPGTKHFRITARDTVGNESVLTITYTVVK